jgi:hypothetical protein
VSTWLRPQRGARLRLSLAPLSCAPARQPASVSIRQHTSAAYVSIRQRMLRYLALQRVSLPQPYVRAPDAWCHRWRQLRRAYVSIRQHMSAYVSIRAWRLASSVAAAAARIRQHTSAYVSIRTWRLASSVAAAAARMQANSASIRAIS